MPHTHQEERERIAYWIELLNKCCSGWIEGDEENKSLKTVDIVNHDLKIAIELKREGLPLLEDRKHKPGALSNRFYKYFTEGNNKFVFYPEYKTILLIELRSRISLKDVPIQVVRSKIDHIGAVVFWPAPGSERRKVHYFENPYAVEAVLVREKDLLKVFGEKAELRKI